MAARSKYFCFTSYVESLPEALPEGLTYLVYQREVCPDTGREHFQGYLEAATRLRLPAIRLLLGDPAVHVEIRRGTGQQAAEYCKKAESRKEGTSPVELGELSVVVQGQRTDLLHMKALMDEGKTEAEVADECFVTWAKHPHVYERYKRLKTDSRDWMTEVFVICGETGVGKSRICKDKFPDAYWKPHGEWWCGYEGQETVVIDDFYGWLKWDILLRICDRYPLLVPTKGGQANFVAKRIIITSNKCYTDWYKDSINVAPLERRITKYSWIGAGETATEDCLSAGGQPQPTPNAEAPGKKIILPACLESVYCVGHRTLDTSGGNTNPTCVFSTNTFLSKNPKPKPTGGV